MSPEVRILMGDRLPVKTVDRVCPDKDVAEIVIPDAPIFSALRGRNIVRACTVTAGEVARSAVGGVAPTSYFTAGFAKPDKL